MAIIKDLRKIFQALILTVLISSIFTGCGYDKNVMVVRDGTLYAAPDVPIGKAFDKFFKNGEWKSFKSKDNKTIVEFTGDCTLYNETSKMTFQFIVQKQEFTLSYVELNGTALDEVERLGIIGMVLEVYRH